MNEKVMAIALLLLMVAGAFVYVANAKGAGTFHFRAWIDGSDYVYLQNAGGKVWYEHLLYIYPGEQSPYSESSPAPTTVNGVDWIPIWDKNAQKSNTYQSSSLENYPSGEWSALEVTKVTNSSDETQSRGPISILDYPSSANGYTAKILLNDDTGSIVYRGAAWYEFELSWETPDQSSEFPYTAVVAVVAAAVAVAALLYVLRRRSLSRQKDTPGT